MGLFNSANGKHAKAAFAARLLASAALPVVAGTFALGVAPALAQEATRSFNIPAQPLDTALNVFGRQSGLQVSLAASTSRGVTARPVSGSLTPQQALSQLLSGTGIPFRISNGTAIVGEAGGSAAVGGGGVAADGSIVLDTITIEGQGIGQGGVAETVIGPQQLERINPTDLGDVFREQPGVQVGSSLPASQKVYVNGIEETNLAVSIDGSRQNNKVFHHNATNVIDPALLRAVAVDAGVAPADAGPGALAGSIAYETKNAHDLLLDGKSIGALVSSTYNFNSNTVTTGLAAYGVHNGLEILGYLNFGKGDNFTAGNGNEVDGTGTDLISGLGKIAYEFESGDRFELSHDRVLDDAERPFRANAGAVVTGKNEPDTRNYRLERQNTVFTYTDTTPEGWWDPKIVLAYSATDVTVPVFLRDGSSYEDTGMTSSLNGKAENKFAFDIGSVTAGLDFYSDKAKLHDPYEPGTEKARNIGLYAQARLEPWEKTRLSFGARADHQRFTGVDDSDFDNSGLSANISGEYDLTDYLTAKAGFSHVSAGVPLAENFIMNPGWQYGDEGPEPVTANNYFLGLEAKHEGFTVEGSVFRTSINNARMALWNYTANIQAPFPGALPALRSREVESQGFEIGAGYDWLTGYVKVKYAHIDVDIDGKPADSDSGNYLATPVGNIITLVAAHTFADWGLTVGGDVEIAPKYQVYDAYEIVNLFAEYKPEQMPNFTFRAEVQNLFDEEYSSRATYGQEFPNVTPLYEPGRSFLLSAKATF
ncbi:TonB-dependent receptor [Oryzicola mucosus]|uniref:TonB-dependent receptor n=1 Tax=Oryzicola mucosus TaxID=2767425 RepID=A0A8J6U0B7_9HYPH|nr:TonB-dependent receptor [Oryzicola mucosus]MBD0415406.1 TonB-dependent receptor [Oryzicola mucosus]